MNTRSLAKYVLNFMLISNITFSYAMNKSTLDSLTIKSITNHSGESINIIFINSNKAKTIPCDEKQSVYINHTLNQNSNTLRSKICEEADSYLLLCFPYKTIACSYGKLTTEDRGAQSTFFGFWQQEAHTNKSIKLIYYVKPEEEAALIDLIIDKKLNLLVMCPSNTAKNLTSKHSTRSLKNFK